MTNQQVLAMNEYMKDESADPKEIMQKHRLTEEEFWEAHKSLKEKASKR